jgi:nucleotide-binding universal stress UspA family protein
MKIQKVLMTTDLSEESERPYGAIAQLARDSGAEVVLFHVVEDVPIVPHGAPLAPPLHAPDVPQQMEKAREILSDHAKKLGDGLTVSFDVVSAQNVGEAVAKHAAENGFDLVALSTHGRTGFRRMIMGSVAEQVLRHSKVPVLAFPRTS